MYLLKGAWFSIVFLIEVDEQKKDSMTCIGKSWISV